MEMRNTIFDDCYGKKLCEINRKFILEVKKTSFQGIIDFHTKMI